MYMTTRMCLRCHTSHSVPHDPSYSQFICFNCERKEKLSKRVRNKFRPNKPSIKRGFK